MMKKWFCMLLSLVILLGLLPYTEALETECLLADAVQAAVSGSVVTLQADTDEDIFVDKHLTLDLNGFSILGDVTVASGCVLTVKDRQTDDYSVEDGRGYGKLRAVTGNMTAAEGYLQIDEHNGISFHKVDMKLTSVTLRPESTGIYYSGEFFGDEVVAENVEVFGIALRLDKMPDAAYMGISSAYSWYDNFASGADGNVANGALLKNVMRKGRPVSENKSNSQRKIYGAPYLYTSDGQYHFGTGIRYSFMQVTQQADGQWERLNQTQKDAVLKMYSRFESVMENWHLPQINGNTDIDIPI